MRNAMSLGVLCRRGHDHDATGKSLRYSTGHCVLCTREYRRTQYANNDELRARALARRAELRAKNKDEEKRKLAEYRAANKELIRLKAQNRYHANPEKSRADGKRLSCEARLEETRAREAAWARKKRASNRDASRLLSREYFRRNSIRISLRNRVYRALKMHGNGKRYSCAQYGIDIEAIAQSLGPCPGSRKEWHIDHRKPLAHFNLSDPEQVRVAFAPSNHQWLEAQKNISKGARYES